MKYYNNAMWHPADEVKVPHAGEVKRKKKKETYMWFEPLDVCEFLGLNQVESLHVTPVREQRCKKNSMCWSLVFSALCQTAVRCFLRLEPWSRQTNTQVSLLKRKEVRRFKSPQKGGHFKVSTNHTNWSGSYWRFLSLHWGDKHKIQTRWPALITCNWTSKQRSWSSLITLWWTAPIA